MITVLKAISQWTLSFFHMLDGIYVTHGISYLDLMVGLYILGLLMRFMKALLITGTTEAVRDAGTAATGSTRQLSIRPMKSLKRSENK